MIEHISAKEYNKKYGSNFKKNKFNAKKVLIGDKVFDSTSEGNLYADLLVQKKAGLIKEIKFQAKESLKGENGTHICNYYVDFLVIHNNGNVEFIEHKGVPTPEWKLKWKMLNDKYKKEIIKGTVILNINWYKPKYNYLKQVKKC